MEDDAVCVMTLQMLICFCSVLSFRPSCYLACWPGELIVIHLEWFRSFFSPFSVEKINNKEKLCSTFYFIFLADSSASRKKTHNGFPFFFSLFNIFER